VTLPVTLDDILAARRAIAGAAVRTAGAEVFAEAREPVALTRLRRRR